MVQHRENTCTLAPVLIVDRIINLSVYLDYQDSWTSSVFSERLSWIREPCPGVPRIFLNWWLDGRVEGVEGPGRGILEDSWGCHEEENIRKREGNYEENRSSGSMHTELCIKWPVKWPTWLTRPITNHLSWSSDHSTWSGNLVIEKLAGAALIAPTKRELWLAETLRLTIRLAYRSLDPRIANFITKTYAFHF